MKIHFLLTVWSDMTVLEDDEHIAIVDTGADYDLQKAEACLNGIAFDKIDLIIITHFHPDHYGLLEWLVSNYRVERVYIKEYSALVATDNTGGAATDEYRKNEYENYERLLSICKSKSHVFPIEDLSSISFNGTALKLYNACNSIRDAYADKSSSAYNKYICNENENSVLISFEYSGINTVLCSDITDKELEHPSVSLLNYKAAKQINRSADIYKAPHHGLGIGCDATLEIYRPRYAFITNNKDYINTNFDDETRLRLYNPNVEIFYASEGGVIFEIDEKGNIIKI